MFNQQNLKIMEEKIVYEIHTTRELSDYEKEIVVLREGDLRSLKRENFNKLCSAIKGKIVREVKEHKMKYVEENSAFIYSLMNQDLLKELDSTRKQISRLKAELSQLEVKRKEIYDNFVAEFKESLISNDLGHLARGLTLSWHLDRATSKGIKDELVRSLSSCNGMGWIEEELICSKDAWDNLENEPDRFIQEYTQKALEYEKILSIPYILSKVRV